MNKRYDDINLATIYYINYDSTFIQQNNIPNIRIG